MNKQGESLIETLIALTILAIGITISSTLVARASRNMQSSENRIVAINIAREGLEAVRNMRDTNWLKFSTNQRQCWNHIAGAGSPSGDLADDICNGNDPLLPGEYVFYKNDEFGWKPGPISHLGNDTTPLVHMDIDPLVDTDADGNSLNDRDMLNHINLPNNDALGAQVAQSIFNRRITIEYLENEPDSTTSPSNNTDPLDSINTQIEWGSLATDADRRALNRWRVTSTVEWQDRGTPRSLRLQTILTDHLGRMNLTD